jgi:valyl-tRNA synthetase
MDEPFTRLLTQGMVLNHIFFRRTAKGGIDYFPPAPMRVRQDESGRTTGVFSKSDGKPVEDGGVGTMSKSKLNGVDPQDMVDRYGADAARLYRHVRRRRRKRRSSGRMRASKARSASCGGLWTFAEANAAAIGTVGGTPDFAALAPR